MVLAVPLFLFLPRLKAPVVRGAEAGREITTGFSDNVDPDIFGTLKSSDRVMLRITSEAPLDEGAGPAPEDARAHALRARRLEEARARRERRRRGAGRLVPLGARPRQRRRR